MGLKVVKGNILYAEEVIIVHQVNCLGVMGAGLARQISNRYPNVLNRYRKYIKKADINALEELLGTVQCTEVYDGHVIANVFGQVEIKTPDNLKVTNEEALLNGIKAVEKYASYSNLSVAIPYGIGSGLGGGDWNYIHEGIKKIFKDSDVSVSLYQLNQ